MQYIPSNIHMGIQCTKMNCRHFGLSTFWFVDVLVCRRFGLSTFWSVDVLVCRRFGLPTFWFVDVLVCRRFGLSTFQFVDVLVCRRFDQLPWHIYASVNWVRIGASNGLSPVRRQAINWTNADLFSIGPMGTNFHDVLIEILTFSFRTMHLKMSSLKWQPFCPGGGGGGGGGDGLTMLVHRSLGKYIIKAWFNWASGNLEPWAPLY